MLIRKSFVMDGVGGGGGGAEIRTCTTCCLGDIKDMETVKQSSIYKSE